MSLTNKLLSGIEFAQNEASQTEALGTSTLYQDFFLPDTIQRGSDANEVRIPPLSGFSILCSVAEAKVDNVCFDWSIERNRFGSGWLSQASGISIGAPNDGDYVWIDVYFDDLIVVDPEAVQDRWRIAITGRTGGGTMNTVVSDWGSAHFTLDGNRTALPSDAPLTKTTPYTFTHNGLPALLHYDAEAGQMLYSIQQDVDSFWYNVTDSLGYETAYRTGDVPIDDTTGRAPIAFRVLTASGDDGRDFLGNQYRHAIFAHKVGNVSTVDGDAVDKHWLSKPNPSRFAIENLYFDVTEGGSAGVIDSVLLDPLTPDIYFHVYYSSEGAPGNTPDEWNNKLWTKIDRTFQAQRRDTFAFPEPVRTKYIKIEFSHLQPRPYQAGIFQQPIRYQKHPKWVLDYYLLRLEQERVSENITVARRVNLRYNALDIAYNYYLDDLSQEPAAPRTFDPNAAGALQEFLQRRQDESDLVDSSLLDKIQLSLDNFKQGHLGLTKGNSLLGQFVLGTSQTTSREMTYNFERNFLTDVSSLNRDAVALEQSFPVTSFYLTARHRYREAQATFSHNRAYFAGVREVAFMRSRYTKATDTNMYIEIGGDSANIVSSDFVHDDNALIISDD